MAAEPEAAARRVPLIPSAAATIDSSPATSSVAGVITQEGAEVRTIWDVLTSVGRDIQVTYPSRPSHALVELPNDWQISVTVSPTSASTLGQRFATGMEQPISTSSVLGRGGSPEGWFDRASEAEVAILRPDSTWYHCEVYDGALDPDHPQPWRFVGVDALARLIVRVTEQPPGCLCPECARDDHTRN